MVFFNSQPFVQLISDSFFYGQPVHNYYMHIVQVLYNILMGHIPISEENKRILLQHKDALLNLARPNVPFKTKTQVLVQEGSGFIEDVLAPVVSSLGFLML